MKRFLVILALLATLPAWATRIEQPLWEITGGGYNAPVKITSGTNSIVAAGAGLVPGPSKLFTPASGVLTISNLVAGPYVFEQGGKSFRFTVTNSLPTITNSLLELAPIGVTYSTTQFPLVSRLTNTDGSVTISPASGQGVVTLSATGGSATNGLATVEYVLGASNSLAADIAELTGGGVTTEGATTIAAGQSLIVSNGLSARLAATNSALLSAIEGKAADGTNNVNAATNALANNLSMRIYNVRDFGAIPDDELVDNLALQWALDYAATNGGGVVYMPRGTYLIGTNYAYPTVTTENSINLICLSSNNITLEGAGIGATILKGHPVAAATARNLFGAGGGANPEPARIGVTNYTLRNFTIDGNYPLCTNIGDATQLYNCDKLTIENVEFKDINGDAFDAAPVGYANATAVIKGCRFQNVKSAIHPGPIAFLSVSDCTFRECGGTNIVGDIDAVWEITSTVASKWERLYLYSSKTNGGLVMHINGMGAHDFTDVNIHLANTVHSVTNMHVVGQFSRVNFTRLRFASDATYNDSVALYGATNLVVNVRDSYFVGKRAIRFEGSTSLVSGSRFENAGTLSVSMSGGRTVVTDNHFTGSSVGLDLASSVATPNSIASRNYFYGQLLYSTGGGSGQIISDNVVDTAGINIASTHSYVVNNRCPSGYIRFSSFTNIISGNVARYLTFNGGNAKWNYIANNFIETCTFIGGATDALTNSNTMLNNRSYTNTWGMAPYGGLMSGSFAGDGSALTNIPSAAVNDLDARLANGTNFTLSVSNALAADIAELSVGGVTAEQATNAAISVVTERTNGLATVGLVAAATTGMLTLPIGAGAEVWTELIRISTPDDGFAYDGFNTRFQFSQDTLFTGDIIGNGASVTNLSGANIQAGTIGASGALTNGSSAALSTLLITNPATAFKAGFSVSTNGTNLTFLVNAGASGSYGTQLSVSNSQIIIFADSVDLGNKNGAYFKFQANQMKDVGNAGLLLISGGGIRATSAVSIAIDQGSMNTLVVTNGTVVVGSKLTIRTNTAEPLASVGSAQFYSLDVSGNAEMFVQGSDGVETQISPHADDAPDFLYDRDVGAMKEMVFREQAPYLPGGRVSFINMRRLAKYSELQTKAILYLSGKTSAGNSNALQKLKDLTHQQQQVIVNETFAEYSARTGRKLQPKVWEEVEAQRQSDYDAERVSAQTELDRILAENATKTAAGDTNLVDLPTVPPAMDVRRPKPVWMR